MASASREFLLSFPEMCPVFPFQDYQFYIQNFTALQLGTVVPPSRQATFEYSFIPAEPMGGRPFGLVINLNYKDSSVRMELDSPKGSVSMILFDLPSCSYSPAFVSLKQGNIFQDAVFNQTVTITEKEDGLDGET